MVKNEESNKNGPKLSCTDILEKAFTHIKVPLKMDGTISSNSETSDRNRYVNMLYYIAILDCDNSVSKLHQIDD